MEKTHYHSRDYLEVRAGDVSSAIKKFQSEVDSDVSSKFYGKLNKFKENIREKTANKFQNLLDNDSTRFLKNISVGKIKTAIRKATDEIEEPKIEYEELPENLNIYKTLQEEEAEKFIERASIYKDDLREEIANSLNDSIKKMEQQLNRTNLTGSIFKNYGKILEKLQKRLQNREQSEKEIKQLIEELEKIKYE